MGAFFLCRKEYKNKYLKSDMQLKSLGFSTYVHCDFNEYDLYVYKKILLKQENYYSSEQISVFGTGTYVYRGLTPYKSLRSIAEDFVKSTIDLDRLIGHYFIFVKQGIKIYILSDGSGIIPAYHDPDGAFLTSSFLLASRIIPRKEIAENGFIENILTGAIAGNDTLLKNITIFSRESVQLFHSVKVITSKEYKQSPKLNSRRMSLEFIESSLRQYMRDLVQIVNENGLDTGLTGGYDSRLLLALIRDTFNNFQVHSHSRNYDNLEFMIAKKIAEDLKIDFKYIPADSIELQDEDDYSCRLQESYKFYDGLIRLHCNWNEIYNTKDYRTKILDKNLLGFHGIGGEQYRNPDRLWLVNWSYKHWLKYKYIKRISGSAFTNIKKETDFFEYIKYKICKILDFEEGKSSLTLYDLKRIQNEVFIPSYRGARTAVENKISYFLSPFADIRNSLNAYSIVPFLNCTNNFEIDLIKRISPDLAKFPSNYGYNFNSKEPFLKYAIPTIFENSLPAAFSWRIREKIKGNNMPNKYMYRIENSYIQNVKDFNPSLNIEYLAQRSDLRPLIISMGYFLENLNKEI